MTSIHDKTFGGCIGSFGGCIAKKQYEIINLITLYNFLKMLTKNYCKREILLKCNKRFAY